MKKLKIKMEKSMWKSSMIIASLTAIALLALALIGFIVDKKIPSLALVFIPLFSVLTLFCIYKFITFGKVYKWYRVIDDTRKSHNMVNTYCEYLWTTGDGRFGVRDTKTGKKYLCDEKDVIEATAEYITKKIENAVIFFAGVTALVILGANVINGGHWFGTIGFAIISFVCFTVFKIENEK